MVIDGSGDDDLKSRSDKRVDPGRGGRVAVRMRREPVVEKRNAVVEDRSN